ncbi:alcohol dehydrogenase [Stenotrophomonas rhizophila]|nr:alcohol dehydrogenase [Stenotrophomonas rhizophila]
MVDHLAYRLAFAAQTYGVTPVDFSQIEDPAQYIITQTNGRGVDASIEAVGFEAEGSALESALTTLKVEGSSGVAIRQCIAATRRCGTVSIPGVYSGYLHGFLLGDAFDKGLTFKMGQTHVQGLMPELLDYIGEGALDPGVIITHRLPLEEAARGYELFDRKEEDCRKVILIP